MTINGGRVLAGAGKDFLEGVVKKVGNIAEHLNGKDVTGAVRDIFETQLLSTEKSMIT